MFLDDGLDPEEAARIVELCLAAGIADQAPRFLRNIWTLEMVRAEIRRISAPPPDDARLDDQAAALLAASPAVRRAAERVAELARLSAERMRAYSRRG